ncbi:putative bifunctional diguanylate cyclase/phosphodiesterase [Gilvimarinus sp. 1_MG-2023]|uniref:putative bifunctional diguanylate cyclase/phosphodiesterase n=1 Tax=Gilvimarinus sp. 1_MG-2023 TaxID=3062638 RepID=UPI0026E41B3C|nr:EAL domain-containing protein [Gilvimarinus sp. 1_MG-2023]MDO6747787.1 EAL domain-containing protein [Gilvimarinus sp. 1_MG-2023]
MSDVQSKYTYSLKVAGLVSGLVSLILIATFAIVAVIHLQGAVTGYLSGLAVWSRYQVNSVYHLSRYAETGEPNELKLGRQYLEVPLADRRARLSMEANEPIHIITGHLMAGRNHPDDADRMILLFEYFGQLGKLQHAFDVWRQADNSLLNTAALADQLELLWRDSLPDPQALQANKQQLYLINQDLERLSTKFRYMMTDTARWLTHVLAWCSIVFILLLVSIAFWLVLRLNRLLIGSQHKYHDIFEQAAVGIVHLGYDDVVRDANPAICNILDCEKSSITGHCFKDFIHSEDWSLDEQSKQQLLNGVIDHYSVEQRLAKNTGYIWARLTYSRSNTHDSARHLTLILEDISESRRLSNELNFQATHDILTGLFNRRAFERRLFDSLNRARSEHVKHALCFIDLDQFKIVNDTSGHPAGDRLLQQVTNLFASILREGDMLARLGGDEFAMILENCAIDAAGSIAEKLRRALEIFEFNWEGHRYDITASIGVVPISEDDLDTESIMRAADIACYLAKEKGRNFVYVAREDDAHRQERAGEMQWVTKISNAIIKNKLLLEAQLIAPLQQQTNGLVYEILIRLEDGGKVYSPSAFLPAAERFGSAPQIDRWVVENTLKILAQNPKHLTQLHKCHINISGLSLDKHDFYQFVLQAFEKYSVAPEKICFEVTETAAVNNLLDAVHFMEALGDSGCSFALDDFGTGLASFNYLKRLPIDTLKIDGSFIREIVKDKTDLAMVKAINEVGQTLSIETVAEFVENTEVRVVLEEIGVDYAQGYGIHKPQKFTDFIAQQALKGE